MLRTAALARLKVWANHTFKNEVNLYEAKITKPNFQINPVYTWVSNILEPILIHEGLSLGAGMSLQAPTWSAKNAPADLENYLVTSLSRLGWKFDQQPALPIVPFRALAHNVVGGSKIPVTCTIKRYSAGSVTVSLSLPFP